MHGTVASDRWVNEVPEDGRGCLLAKKREINFKNTPIVRRVTERDRLVKDQPGGNAQHRHE